MAVQVLKKKLAGTKMGQLGPKMGQNEVLGHFLVRYALVFAGYAYHARQLCYLVADGG